MKRVDKNIRTTFEALWNSMEHEQHKLKLHGIPGHPEVHTAAIKNIWQLSFSWTGALLYTNGDLLQEETLHYIKSVVHGAEKNISVVLN